MSVNCLLFDMLGQISKPNFSHPQILLPFTILPAITHRFLATTHHNYLPIIFVWLVFYFLPSQIETPLVFQSDFFLGACRVALLVRIRRTLPVMIFLLSWGVVLVVVIVIVLVKVAWVATLPLNQNVPILQAWLVSWALSPRLVICCDYCSSGLGARIRTWLLRIIVVFSEARIWCVWVSSTPAASVIITRWSPFVSSWMCWSVFAFIVSRVLLECTRLLCITVLLFCTLCRSIQFLLRLIFSFVSFLTFRHYSFVGAFRFWSFHF